MDDDYELVSKSMINKLREENKKLKEGVVDNKALNNTNEIENEHKKEQKPSVSPELVSEIIKTLKEESQKERGVILTHLEEIKELNKSTLDNIITKTEGLDVRLESMIDTISGLVKSLSEVMDNIKSSDHSEIKTLFDKLEKSISNQNNGDVVNKLEEIGRFMQNLRILLSYVKPSDIVMDKNNLKDNIGNKQFQ